MDDIPYVPDPGATVPPMLFSKTDIEAEVRRLQESRSPLEDSGKLDPADLEWVQTGDNAPKTPEVALAVTRRETRGGKATWVLVGVLTVVGVLALGGAVAFLVAAGGIWVAS